MSLSLLALGLAGLAVLPGVFGQSTNVTTCNVSAYNALANDAGQNVCLMAAYARGVCVGGPFTMNSIEPNHHYIPNDPNPCECSEVVYSLVSACGLCQGRIIINWSNWIDNCNSPSDGPFAGFPMNIPPGTAFPAWAYQDVSTPNNFSLSVAQGLLSRPESTGVTKTLANGQSTATSATTTGGGNPGTTTRNNSPTNSTGSSGGSGGGSNAGAIAGGVVGGVVGLALIAGLVAWLVLRNRKKNEVAPSMAYAASTNYATSGFEGGAQNGHYEEPKPFNGGFNKPYDPSDPSTYPQSPGTPTIHTTMQPQGYGHGGATHQPGQYSGVAEL